MDELFKLQLLCILLGVTRVVAKIRRISTQKAFRMVYSGCLISLAVDFVMFRYFIQLPVISSSSEAPYSYCSTL